MTQGVLTRRMSAACLAFAVAIVSIAPPVNANGYLTGESIPVVWLTSNKQVGCSNQTTTVREMLTKVPQGLTLKLDVPSQIKAMKKAMVKITFTLDSTLFNVTDKTVKDKGDFSIPHVNIHSCLANIGACTPFVSNTPGLATHTSAQARDFTSTSTAVHKLDEDVGVILPKQKYMIIGHVRFFTAAGKYDMAIGVPHAVIEDEEESKVGLYVGLTAGGFVFLIILAMIGLKLKSYMLEKKKNRLQAELLARRKAAQGSKGGEDWELPQGHGVLVDTDVESSTALWEWNPTAMSEALLLHDEVMRNEIQEYKGKELLTEGDAFLIYFAKPLQAAQFGLSLQEKLMKTAWSETLLKSGNESSSAVPGLFSGLRVRMGAHYGQMDVPSTALIGQSDLLRETREISDFAHGGQFLISNQLFAAVQTSLDTSVDIFSVGNVSGLETTVSQAVSVVQILPGSLKARGPEFIPLLEDEDDSKVRPPAGEITAVFTSCPILKKVEDVKLRQSEGHKLDRAISEHALQHKGYECKGESGKFFIVFQSTQSAAAFACSINHDLMALDWSKELKDLQNSAVEAACGTSPGTASSYNGPALCIGMVTGAPQMFQFNKVAGKMDYFGPVVNRAARVAATSAPGEISVGPTTKTILQDPSPEYTISSRGKHALKGVDTELEIFTMLPKGLEDRQVAYDALRASLPAFSSSVSSAVSPESKD